MTKIALEADHLDFDGIAHGFFLAVKAVFLPHHLTA